MTERCILLGMLYVLARADARTRELPLPILLLSACAGIGIYVLKRPFSGWELAGGAAVGGFLLLCSLLSRESIGRGDGYLFCVTGIFLGFRENLALLLTALALTAAIACFLLLAGRCGRRSSLPFAPFVLAAQVLLWCG